MSGILRKIGNLDTESEDSVKTHREKTAMRQKGSLCRPQNLKNGRQTPGRGSKEGSNPEPSGEMGP